MTPDAEDQWRKDMEREARGNTERSEWDKHLSAMEDYWARYGYSQSAPGTYWSLRFTQMDNWLEDNRRLVQDYGPGPASLWDMIYALPGGQTLDGFRYSCHVANLDRKKEGRESERMMEDEFDAAEKGYRIPPPNTSLEERRNLLMDFKQKGIEAEMDQLEAEAIQRGYRTPPRGTVYEERKRLLKDWLRNNNLSQQYGPGPSMGNPYGMGFPSGYPQYGPSFLPLAYAQFIHMGESSADDAWEREKAREQRERDERYDHLKKELMK